MARIEVTTRTAPAAWAVYILNDDPSYLSEAEQDAACAWLEALGAEGWWVTACDESGNYTLTRATREEV